MQITKTIRGTEYVFEIPFNQLIAKSMANSYYGYRIEDVTEAYSTKLYRVNTSEFLPKETKLIGTLIYEADIDRITLYKFVDMTKHKFEKTESFGINNEVISRLRPKDRVFISNGKQNYIISIRKALTVGKYLQFDKYEKQLFVPISEFKLSEVKKKKQRRIKK